MSRESIDRPPTLRELTAFPTRSHRKVNIPQEIGVKYQVFGAQLLEDPTGTGVINMEHKHRGDPLRINTEICREWLKGHGKRPVSWRTLIEVLRDLELGELARDIEVACLQGKITVNFSGWGTSSPNLWQNRRKLFRTVVLVQFTVIFGYLLISAFTGNARTQPSIAPGYVKVVIDKAYDQSIENLAPGVAVSTTIQSTILEYNKILNDTYQKQPVTDPSQWLQVMMPFISLTLMEGNVTDKWTMQSSIESQLHNRYKLSLDDIVYSVKKGSKILMEGRPGVGKSTIMRHIAKQWAEGKFLRSFQLVILIQLGHIPSSKITNLESMLEYHSHDYPDTASVARELGRTGGEGICFLLDALDEYSPHIPTHSDYIYQLIRGERLPNAAFIVTSRPSASHPLQQEFTRKIEVVGFLQHQIQQYINALPANNAATISEYINRYTNVKRISYLPLHLAMVTYLALHSERVSLLDLDTETRIYHMFVNLTFRQRYKDVENLDEVHRQAFSALSKTAFDATTRYSDSETSLRLHHLDPELKVKVESFSILTINKRHEGDKVGEIFTFSHYSFQEFFAAYHLTTLPHEEQMQALILYKCSSLLMWRFFFGLLRAHSSKNTTKLFERFAHIHCTRSYYSEHNIVLMCAYELKQTAIAEVLVQTLNHSITGINHPSDCAAVGYALSLNSHQFNKLMIFGYTWFPAEDYWEACFDSMFAELPESSGVEQVLLWRLVICNRTISALARFVRHFPNLQQLSLVSTDVRELKPYHSVLKNRIDNYNLGYTETVKFATELERLKHLRQLWMFLNQGNAEMVKFVTTVLEHLQHVSTLQSLHLSLDGRLGYDKVVVFTAGVIEEIVLDKIEMSDRDAAKLAECIKHLTSLKELVLYNKIGDRCAAKLADSIKHLLSLETLHLSENIWNGIGYCEVVALTRGVKDLISLKELVLVKNEMGDRGAAMLAEGIKHLTSLETLNLAWNRIGYDGVVALTGGVKNLTSLKTLVLSDNEIGDGGAAKLAEGIKHLASLETLNLGWNSIGIDGAVALTGGIKSLTSLKVLDLSNNKIGDRGAAKLAEGIKHLASLETLNLAWNSIGIDGAVALTGGIKSLTSLKVLDLSNNKMGDRGATKLAEGIKHLISLESLKLHSNRIGDDGVVALTGSIKGLTSLKVLDLSNNKIGDRGAAKLAEEKKLLNSLEFLHLSHNKIGHEEMAKLSEALNTGHCYPIRLDTRMNPN